MESSSLIFVLYFRKYNFPSQKSKKICPEKFLIFREMEVASPNPEKRLIFQERTCKTWKTNCNLYSSKA